MVAAQAASSTSGRRSSRIVSRIVRTMLRRVSAMVPSKSKMTRRTRCCSAFSTPESLSHSRRRREAVFFLVTRQSKRRFVRVNASRGVYSDKGVYLAGSFWGRRCVNWHEKPCWRASAAPGSAFKEQGAARGGRFAEAVCQSKRLPLLGTGFTICRMLSRWDREPPFGDATRTPGP